MAEGLETVFAALRDIMLESASGMTVSTDEPGNLVLKASWAEPGKKDLAWFGAVQRKKSYVSYHLMPLYAVPALASGIGPDLQKRMQGKSCFNFKTIDPVLFEALESMTRKCADAYAAPVSAAPHTGQS